METVVWNLVRSHEAQRLLACPVKQRVRLHQAVPFVERNRGKSRAAGGLVGANAGDPAGTAGKSTLEWGDFADTATIEAGGERGSQAADALLGDQRFQICLGWGERCDPAAVTFFGFGPDLVGFRKQPPGIERSDIDGEASQKNGMG